MSTRPPVSAAVGAADDDDDAPRLSASTLALLQEFMRESEAAKTREAEEASDKSAALVTAEDWELSQFWYDTETSLKLAREMLNACGHAPADTDTHTHTHARADGERHYTLACISCPSIYKALMSLPPPPNVTVYLLEYDKRFGVFGDRYVYYDFNSPTAVPSHLHGACDVIALDPPFLQRDTLAAFAETVALMRKAPATPVMLCTGAVMLPHARELLQLRPVREHVGHQKGQLQNPFALYVNFDPSRLGGYDVEAEEAAAADAARDAASTAAGGSA